MAYKIVIAVAIILFSAYSYAGNAVQSKPIRFAKGSSSATVHGTIKGRNYMDYKLIAKAGQTMTVKFKTSNFSSYFNVLPPESEDVAIFVGSMNGNEWSGLLDKDGSYTIRVYLTRNAARRNEIANYTLTVGVEGKPAGTEEIGEALSSDAKVRGTQYHAVGALTCSMGKQPQEQCKFGVIRGTTGNAEVHLKLPGGFERILTFIGSKVTSNGGDDVKVTKSVDLWSVNVNDYEYYQIPDAVISGG